jgi:uncharacterized protein (TIGR04255 family)
VYLTGAGRVTQVTSQGLPEYEKPPVTEVVCGILFKTIEALLVPHFGMLWERFKPEYPGCQELAPIAPTIERFGELAQAELQLSDIPPLPRIWFLHDNNNEIIQVQRDRFLYNWRKTEPEDEYPRYRSVIRKFQTHLSKFQTFLGEIDLGTITPVQYELTYVNHIPQGDGWDEFSDIGKVFPDCTWQGRRSRFLPFPEGINWRTSFTLPNFAGRLHVRIQKGIRRKDGHPLLLFELTGRGIGSHTSLDEMWTWFDLAHEWIVHGFADLTAPQIQKSVWRRKK